MIAADVWSEHLTAVKDVDYVLHNFNGSHHVCENVEPERLLRLQVYTNAATGVEWDHFRLFNLEARTLFQPWGTNLLAEEFMEPTYGHFRRDVVFVGAIWSEIYEGEDLGNFSMIQTLKQLCAEKNLNFKHFTHITDVENAEMVRRARVAPAFAGGWQVKNNYLPCRVFKNVSYGCVGFTNVPGAAALLGSPKDETMEETFDRVLSLKTDDYEQLVRKQQKVAARYTYRESLESIVQALQEIKK